MKLVRQEEEKGCVIACIAMVMKKSYWDIRRDFTQDFEAQGLGFDTLADYMADHGYHSIRKKIAYWDKTRASMRDEMIAPFAPVHIVHLQLKYDGDWHHAVVMDKNGDMYDPGGHEEEVLQGTYAVLETIGFYK